MTGDPANKTKNVRFVRLIGIEMREVVHSYCGQTNRFLITTRSGMKEKRAVLDSVAAEPRRIISEACTSDTRSFRVHCGLVT
jgi:hypothetical protein